MREHKARDDFHRMCGHFIFNSPIIIVIRNVELLFGLFYLFTADMGNFGFHLTEVAYTLWWCIIILRM